MESKSKKRVFGYVEAVFDILYLLTALGIALVILWRASTPVQVLAGAMALVLPAGDLFHLLPRIGVIFTGDTRAWHKALGAGKFITSLTMTAFYVMLYHVGMLVLNADVPKLWTVCVYALAAVRILLCLLPQNRWLEEAPPVNWAIYRNIPFVLLGVIVAVLYAGAQKGSPVSGMSTAIAISFACYLPVVLFAHKSPKVGMLMLPKSCAYVWMLLLCVSI